MSVELLGRTPQVEGGHTDMLYKARLGVRAAALCVS